MQLHPLGDQAVLAACADETAASRFASGVRAAAYPWTIDVVQAYRSVAVYYDLTVIDFFQAAEQLANMEESRPFEEPCGRLFTIPCCYDFGLDWPRLGESTGLPVEDIIRLHCSTVFTVYAIGFCPGFPYMGYLPAAIAGVPRLSAPRLKVAAGSVGLTGRQTGIYTEERPGGWNIVGRTPLELVNVREEYFPLRTGDRVKFRRIDTTDYYQLSGERLPQHRGQRQ